MKISSALSICAFLSSLSIHVFGAALTPPPDSVKSQYVPLPVYVQVPGQAGGEPSYAQLYAPANSQVQSPAAAPQGNQLTSPPAGPPAGPPAAQPVSPQGAPPTAPAAPLGNQATVPSIGPPAALPVGPPAALPVGPPAAQPLGPAVAQPVTPPIPNAQMPAGLATVANAQLPAQQPVSPVVAAPVSPVLSTDSGLQCKCPTGKAPVMFAGLCICGDCPKVSEGVTSYNKTCPDSKFAEFNRGLEEKCKKIENTEDCEFFKSQPGALTDDYKRCRDQLDSIMDDCENATACCSTMVKPGAPPPADD